MPQNQTPSHSGPKPLDEAVKEWVSKVSKTNDDGNYAREAERVVEIWRSWASDRGAETVSDIDTRTMMRYAERLHRRADAREADEDNEAGITGRTAQQYYAYVQAFLSYCTKWGYLSDNPATGPAESELPDESLGAGSTDQQFWSPRERTQFLRYVDKRAHSAIDERGSDAFEETRDRALVYLLAYSGARSAEVLRDPNDARRGGLTWGDLDLEGGLLTVLGKNQDDNEEVQLPEQAHPAIERYKQVLDPPVETWPVFPTRHPYSLYKTARGELGDLVDDLEEQLSEEGPGAVLRRYEVPPPSITTESCRRIFRRLCEEGDIDVEGNHEYLKPHGARRGVGEVVYRTTGATAAQRVLRHADPSTTSEMYSHLEAGDQAEIASEAFDEMDG